MTDRSTDVAARRALRAGVGWAVPALLALVVRAGGWRPLHAAAATLVFGAVAVGVFALHRLAPALAARRGSRVPSQRVAPETVVAVVAATLAIAMAQALWTPLY